MKKARFEKLNFHFGNFFTIRAIEVAVNFLIKVHTFLYQNQ